MAIKQLERIPKPVFVILIFFFIALSVSFFIAAELKTKEILPTQVYTTEGNTKGAKVGIVILDPNSTAPDIK
jgi:hypothetical protein